MAENEQYHERELLRRISEGDEGAFTKFFFQKVLLLQPAIGRLTRYAGDAEEVIQETFIKLWMNRDKLPEIENIDGYIYKMAFFQYQLYLRKEIAMSRREIAAQDQQPETDESLLHHLRSAELKELIRASVDELPEQRKLIYKMSRDEGKTNAEIAATLGISVQTVKNSLVIALKAIRKYLAEAGYILPLILYGIIL